MCYTFRGSFYALITEREVGKRGKLEWFIATSVDILQLAYFILDGNSVVNGGHLIHGSALICDNDYSMHVTTCVLVMIIDESHVFDTQV